MHSLKLILRKRNIIPDSCLFLKTFLSYSTREESCSSVDFAFVPKHWPCSQENLDQLQQFVSKSKKLCVLSGAGISTESGIPDYRSEEVGLYATSNRRPVQFQEFVKSWKVRQSYWARNFVAWPKFSSFQPNVNHKIIADWELKGKVHCVLTQNVDRLHNKAGSKHLIELHGSADRVHCLSCCYTTTRHEFQKRLSDHNQHLTLKPSSIKPDGDAELTEEEVKEFRVPGCPECGDSGVLKPDIVFFGDSVPKARVEEAKRALASSDAFLAVGTSLTVYSAYRFVLHAADHNIPMAIINIGETRGDKYASLRVPARCGQVLPLIRVEEQCEALSM